MSGMGPAPQDDPVLPCRASVAAPVTGAQGCTKALLEELWARVPILLLPGLR